MRLSGRHIHASRASWGVLRVCCLLPGAAASARSSWRSSSCVALLPVPQVLVLVLQLAAGRMRAGAAAGALPEVTVFTPLVLVPVCMPLVLVPSAVPWALLISTFPAADVC